VATQADLERTLENLKARIAALGARKADYESLAAAITAFGDTQQMLADVLRGYGGEMRSTADDSNQRIRSLEASASEIKELLVRALER
jgi:ABC-type transporter Mla subunit MlaD